MKTFKKGGVHPPDMKERTRDIPIADFPAPESVSIPMAQHFGSPAICIVGAGDKVLKGQLIGKADGRMSANVHSSVSGNVLRIEEKFTPQGKPCKTVVIENDRENRWAEGVPCTRDWQKMSPEEIVTAVTEAGVVGMGGAAFPAGVKLTPSREKPVDTAILNGVECEPYLTIDHRLMVERAEEIIGGLSIIVKAVGAKRAVVGIESNKPEAYESMCKAAGGKIEIEMLDVKYPQGAEKPLINALTGREVPPGKLPFDVGVVVHNVGTAWAIFNAVTKCMPLIERPLTVSGDAIERPANLIVPIGTPVGSVIEHCGLDPKVKKILSGGPMMGVAIADSAIPVVKGTSGILALKKIPRDISGPCIRCGRCIQVCPLGGIASEMARAIEAGALVDYEHLHVFDCMECGACSFVCPAGRNLVQYVRQAKEEAAYRRELHRKQQKKP